MATFFVDNSGLVTTASTVADSIFVQSAALPNSTILGLGGNDTINLTEGAGTNASSLSISVKAGGGADSITISAIGAFSAGNASIYGGAGNDTVIITGGTYGLIKTQDDADVLLLSGDVTIENLKLGKGADSVTLQSGTLTTVGFGKGHDHFSATEVTLGTAATINLGEGRDTIVIETMDVTLSGATILGDAAGGTNYGADSIFIDGLQSGSTVKGQGGDDTITISGDVATKLFINGGGENDVITISGYEAGSTIGGGSGADTIVINEGLADSGYFNGGSGNDSIHLEITLGSADISKNLINGGAGADTITLSSTASDPDLSGGTLATFTYSAFSESNLSTLDVVNFDLNNGSGSLTVNFDYGVDLSAAVITERSAIALAGTPTTFSGNIAAGIVTLSGNANVSSVTAVASTVDTLTLPDGANEIAIFTTKGGEDYLFVQGGSAGLDDDSIVSMANISGNFTLTTTNNTAAVVISGNKL